MTISYSKSVFALKENAQFTIYDEDLDNIVWHDGNPTNITKEQIIAKDAELKAVENAKPENITKASGNTKLLALGLTQAEATALTGYTPPVAE